MFIRVLKLDVFSEAFVLFLTKMVPWTGVSNSEPTLAATLVMNSGDSWIGAKTVFDTLTLR